MGEIIYLNRLEPLQKTRLEANGVVVSQVLQELYGECWEAQLPEGTEIKLIHNGKGKGPDQRALLFPSGDGVVWFWNRIEGEQEWLSTISLPTPGIVKALFDT